MDKVWVINAIISILGYEESKELRKVKSKPLTVFDV